MPRLDQPRPHEGQLKGDGSPARSRDFVSLPRSADSSRVESVSSSLAQARGRRGMIGSSSALSFGRSSSPISRMSFSARKWMKKDAKEIMKLKAAAASRNKAIETEQEEQLQLRAFHSELQHVLKRLAVVTILSLPLAVAINEACASTDYHDTTPPEADLDRIENGNGRQCAAEYGEYLKMVGTVLTFIMYYLIIRRHGIKLRLALTKKKYVKSELARSGAEEGLQASLDFLRAKSSTGESAKVPSGCTGWGGLWLVWYFRKSSLSAKMYLLLELLLCGVHQFPGLVMDIKVNILGERMFYRFESISCGFMMTRLYHVWRWVYLSAYLHYFDMNHTFIVQDHSTIHLMREGGVQKRRLAIKVGVSRHPLQLIGSGIALLILVISYLIRIAEGPAHQPHSQYYWDQMWITITQGTTGYGASTPQTHLGRFFSVIMMFCGPIFVAFVTATTTRFLEMSAEDQDVVQRMDENRLKSKLLEASALLLQNWFRVRRASKGLEELAASGTQQRRARATLPLQAQERHTELLKDFYLSTERLRKFRARHKQAAGARSRAASPRPSAQRGSSPQAWGHEASLPDVMREVRKVMMAVRQVGERVQRMEASMEPAGPPASRGGGGADEEGVLRARRKSARAKQAHEEAERHLGAHQAGEGRHSPDRPGAELAVPDMVADGKPQPLRRTSGQLAPAGHDGQDVAAAGAARLPTFSKAIAVNKAWAQGKQKWSRNESELLEGNVVAEGVLRSPDVTPRSKRNLMEHGWRLGPLRRPGDKGGGASAGLWHGGMKAKENGRSMRTAVEGAGIEADIVMWKAAVEGSSEAARRTSSPPDSAPRLMEPTPRLANLEKVRAGTATSMSPSVDRGQRAASKPVPTSSDGMDTSVMELARDMIAGLENIIGGEPRQSAELEPQSDSEEDHTIPIFGATKGRDRARANDGAEWQKARSAELVHGARPSQPAEPPPAFEAWLERRLGASGLDGLGRNRAAGNTLKQREVVHLGRAGPWTVVTPKKTVALPSPRQNTASSATTGILKSSSLEHVPTAEEAGTWSRQIRLDKSILHDPLAAHPRFPGPAPPRRRSPHTRDSAGPRKERAPPDLLAGIDFGLLTLNTASHPSVPPPTPDGMSAELSMLASPLSSPPRGLSSELDDSDLDASAVEPTGHPPQQTSALRGAYIASVVARQDLQNGVSRAPAKRHNSRMTLREFFSESPPEDTSGKRAAHPGRLRRPIRFHHSVTDTTIGVV